MNCPTCGGSARFLGRRGKDFVSVVGVVRIERPYYHCAACRAGVFPWDAELGVTKAELTPAAEQVVALAGATGAFREAAGIVLPKLAGMRVSESTVERTTEAAGERAARRLQAGETFGTADPDLWDWHPDAEGKTVAYVSLDATGVGIQGPGGGKVEGRMAYVAMVYLPAPADAPPASGPMSARYLAGFYDLEELGRQLRRQAAQVGMGKADRQVALADGGNGLEEFLRIHFPLAECILDFWHAAGHVAEFADLYAGGDPARKAALTDRWCRRMREKGGSALLKTIAALDLTGRGEAAAERRRKLVNYMTDNAHRMDYPTYLERGWHIGSGPVEAACKTVVGGRLKGTGMRCSGAGADSVCRLRALLKSEPGQWDAFWSPAAA